MKNIKTSEILKNIFVNNIYRTVLLSTISFIIIGFILIQKILLPLFQTHMMNIVIDKAKKTGNHIAQVEIFSKEQNSVLRDLYILKYNFNIEKLKLFDKDGYIKFSTDNKDIGKKNDKDYFHNIVAKGDIYYKIVTKGTKTLENRIVLRDVAEIYVPIMENNKFLGASEIYYDITENREAFSKLITKINSMYYIVAVIFSLALFIMLYRLSKANLLRILDQNKINKLNKHLKTKVKKRTLELEKANEELKILAKHDSLTGIYNRGYFLKLVNRYFDISKRNNSSLFILSFDLDYFKKVNDECGHATGDEALKVFTQIILKYMRKSDILGRIGGEEFVVCLQNISENGALTFANKIQKELEHTRIECNDKYVYITVSIGIAKLEDENTYEKVLEKSDIALYDAKKSGRNRVKVYKNKN